MWRDDYVFLLEFFIEYLKSTHRTMSKVEIKTKSQNKAKKWGGGGCGKGG